LVSRWPARSPGCDAAYTLAMAYGPGENAFIGKMNAEARSLGLTQTYFSNFDGNCLLFAAARNGLSLIGVVPGTPGDDVSATGPVATRLLNWGFSYF
jgi:D-alanyl-D-alanine carboxypeptidase